MNEPIYSFSHEHSVVLGCPHPEGAQPCYIPLPLRSPLGVSEGLSFRALGDWPLSFVCMRHRRVFVCGPDCIELETDMRLPGQPVSSLWKIECRCAREGCGRIRTLYTGRMPDWPSVAQWLLKTTPDVTCGDHNLIWQEDMMLATEFLHDLDASARP